MIRSLKFPLQHTNKAKLQDLHNVMVEYNRVVNVFIPLLHSSDKLPRHPHLKTPTWLSTAMQSSAVAQALAILHRLVHDVSIEIKETATGRSFLRKMQLQRRRRPCRRSQCTRSVSSGEPRQ